MEGRCRECRFSLRMGDAAPARRECRRFPPTKGGYGAWPIVDISDWCGEWRLAPDHASGTE